MVLLSILLMKTIIYKMFVKKQADSSSALMLLPPTNALTLLPFMMLAVCGWSRLARVVERIVAMLTLMEDGGGFLAVVDLGGGDGGGGRGIEAYVVESARGPHHRALM